MSGEEGAVFYALRYQHHVPVESRKHVHTLGRWADYAEADAERERRPAAKLLEVVRRVDGRAS